MPVRSSDSSVLRWRARDEVLAAVVTEPFARRALSFDLRDLPVPAELLVYTTGGTSAAGRGRRPQATTRSVFSVASWGPCTESPRRAASAR